MAIAAPWATNGNIGWAASPSKLNLPLLHLFIGALSCNPHLNKLSGFVLSKITWISGCQSEKICLSSEISPFSDQSSFVQSFCSTRHTQFKKFPPLTRYCTKCFLGPNQTLVFCCKNFEDISSIGTNIRQATFPVNLAWSSPQSFFLTTEWMPSAPITASDSMTLSLVLINAPFASSCKSIISEFFSIWISSLLIIFKRAFCKSARWTS